MKLEKAIKLAERLHRGEFEKYAPETEFFVHLERVAAKVEGETAKVVAYLHEVIEEGKITFMQLAAKGLTYEQFEALALVTREKEITYFAYIERIAKTGNAIATAVKIADLRVHLEFGTIPETLHKRYVKALGMLGVTV